MLQINNWHLEGVTVYFPCVLISRWHSYIKGPNSYEILQCAKCTRNNGKPSASEKMQQPCTVTRTLKGNEKRTAVIELAGFSRLIINSLLISSTSVYNTVKIKLISRQTNTFCNNGNDYAFLRQCRTVKCPK